VIARPRRGVSESSRGEQTHFAAVTNMIRALGLYATLGGCLFCGCSEEEGRSYTEGVVFHETWDPAVHGSVFTPTEYDATTIVGSEGLWYVDATATDADNTPHYAEVVGDANEKRVKLAANRSYTAYANNIWLWWDRDFSGRSQQIPNTPNTHISFEEVGETLGSPCRTAGVGNDNCGPLT